MACAATAAAAITSRIKSDFLQAVLLSEWELIFQSIQPKLDRGTDFRSCPSAFGLALNHYSLSPVLASLRLGSCVPEKCRQRASKAFRISAYSRIGPPSKSDEP